MAPCINKSFPGASSFCQTCVGLRGQNAQPPSFSIQVKNKNFFHLRLRFWRYHHYVQQQIKKRRRGKKVKIQFPKDVLKSGKYQSMLHNKVRSWQTKKHQGKLFSHPAGHSAWTLVSTLFPWVCWLVDKVSKFSLIFFSSTVFQVSLIGTEQANLQRLLLGLMKMPGFHSIQV